MIAVWILLFILSAPLLVLELYCLDDVLVNDGTNTPDRIQQETTTAELKTPTLEDKIPPTTPALLEDIKDKENIQPADSKEIDISDAWNDSGVRSELPGLLAEFCPGANVCQEEKSWQLSEKVNSSSCCRACSCSDNCQASNNCCFSTPSPGINVNNKHTHCYSTLHPAGDDSEQLGYKSYMMVDSEMSQSTMTNNSTCGDTKVAPWGSLHPVYSKSHRIIYKNSVCAAAYGVNDGIQWKPHVACSHIKLLMSYVMTSTALLNKLCDVWFTFPEDISILEEHLCFLKLVSTCPEKFSVTTSMPDEPLKAACESGLFSPYRGRNRGMYRNVFCSLCNGKYNNKGCMDEGTAVRTRRTFTGLLDSSVAETFTGASPYTRVQQACLFEDGIMIESTCRPVSCPSDQMHAAGGKCKFIFKTWYKPQITVGLKLMSDVVINTAGLTERSFISPWSQRWDISKIYYMTHAEGTQPETTNTILVILRQRIANVNPEILMSNVNKLKNKVWTVKSANDSLPLRTDFLDAVDDYYLQTDTRVLSIKQEINDTRRLKTIYALEISTYAGHFTISRMSFCDQVDLISDEFRIRNRVLYNNISGGYLLPAEYFYPNLNDETFVRVCIEDSGIKRVRNGCNAPVSNMCLFFICIHLMLYIY